MLTVSASNGGRPTMEYRPLPLLGNPHVQTVLGNLFRGRRPKIPSSTLR